jgi:hypothetical protein
MKTPNRRTLQYQSNQIMAQRFHFGETYQPVLFNRPHLTALLLSSALLASCGGGSGSAAPAAAATIPAATPAASTTTGSATPDTGATPATGTAAGTGTGAGTVITPPATTPASFGVTSTVIAPGNGGKLFSVKANFFDDGFVPANPVSNYGFPNPIITYANIDGSVDVAWLDYAGTGGQNAGGLSTPHAINITHVNADLSTGTTTNTGILSYKLLGFTRDSAGAYYLAYNADHPFKNAVAGDVNNVNGNMLKVAKSASASFTTRLWDTLVFGDKDNHADGSKGNPGTAGSGVLAYDAASQKLLIYVAHQMAWGLNGTRHQAGYLRYVDPVSGKLIAPGGASDFMGTGWLYSHNFNQRLLMDNGTAYLLAHGDAYPRQLGFLAYSYASYAKNDSALFDQSYLAIDGAEGDNATNAQTGQFIKLANGTFAIVHATGQARAARDVRIVVASGTDGTTKASAWLTTNAAGVQAVTPKLEASGDNIVVTYGLWKSADRTNKSIEWHIVLLDANLKVLASHVPTGVEFTADAPLIRFGGGPNAGRVGWISGNDAGTISVNLISAP